MNRIVLKVNLFGFTGVQIDLYHLDSRFISDDKQYLHFNTQKAKDEFLIYSRRKLAITVNSLRVPDKEYYQAAQSIKHNFESEEERYKFLKGLYSCLCEWNDNYTAFVKDKDTHKRRNRNMIMSGEFWVI